MTNTPTCFLNTCALKLRFFFYWMNVVFSFFVNHSKGSLIAKLKEISVILVASFSKTYSGIHYNLTEIEIRLKIKLKNTINYRMQVWHLASFLIALKKNSQFTSFLNKIVCLKYDFKMKYRFKRACNTMN